eukprot:CAMPEP_0184289452 /NCGR_PEP_ID=MMETSP1049-20130417/1927_1 /TAXON_ID=77928 /ORGANISM="Proteomonas sulcata, Strain CCMP704" /LENGTH=68 /DNA_ID=CAMNT_0026596289 /DNA_START=265 /DNA_END=471 /DNA_ORIENTATION=+
MERRVDVGRSGSDVGSAAGGAAADAAAALKAVEAGGPVQQTSDKWEPTAEARRESAEALRMVQESCNW